MGYRADGGEPSSCAMLTTTVVMVDGYGGRISWSQVTVVLSIVAGICNITELWFGMVWNLERGSGPSFQILFGTRAFWIWNRFGTQPVRRSGTLELSRMVWNDFRRHPLSADTSTLISLGALQSCHSNQLTHVFRPQQLVGRQKIPVSSIPALSS